MKTPLEFLRYRRYRHAYTKAPKLNHTSPVDVTLELSSHCNLACSYCYHSDQENLPFTKGVMAYRTAEFIIAESHDLKVPSLKFNWKGEATINPEFKRITAFAMDHASGYTFQERFINSNFKFRLDRDDIFDGLCNLTKVKVSFDSFIPEVMEAQRVGSKWNQIAANIDKFYNYNHRKNTELVIQAVRTKLNKDEDLESQMKKRWPSATLSIREMVTGRVDSERANELKNKDRDASERQSCIQAHSRLIFRYDGVAFPCCPDIRETMPLGDITKVTMKRIWNSYEAQTLRRDLKSGKAFECGTCKNCSSFETYKGYKAPWGS